MYIFVLWGGGPENLGKEVHMKEKMEQILHAHYVYMLDKWKGSI